MGRVRGIGRAIGAQSEPVRVPIGEDRPPGADRSKDVGMALMHADVVGRMMESVLGLPASIGGNVPALPGAPAVEVLLFESPTPAIIALVVAGLAAFFAMRARGQAGRGALVGGGLALVAAGLVAMASLVVTPREAMSTRTRELVRAVATVDVATLRELLAPDARMINDRFPLLRDIDASSRDEILANVQEHLGREHAVQDWAILKMQAKRDGPNAGRTQTQVRVDAGGPNFSWWRIDWRLEEDGQWRVIGIEPLFIGGLGG